MQAIDVYLFWFHKQDLFPCIFSLQKEVGEGRFRKMERNWEVAVSKSRTLPRADGQ